MAVSLWRVASIFFEYIGSSYEVALYGAHSERRIFDFAHEAVCLSGESSTDDNKTGDCAYASYGFHIDRIEPMDVTSDDILSRSWASLSSKVVQLQQSGVVAEIESYGTATGSGKVLNRVSEC